MTAKLLCLPWYQERFLMTGKRQMSYLFSQGGKRRIFLDLSPRRWSSKPSWIYCVHVYRGQHDLEQPAQIYQSKLGLASLLTFCDRMTLWIRVGQQAACILTLGRLLPSWDRKGRDEQYEVYLVTSCISQHSVAELMLVYLLLTWTRMNLQKAGGAILSTDPDILE